MTRKGARSRAEIPRAVLSGLNEGRLESATLAEGLAVDQAVLIRHVAPEIAKSSAAKLHEAGIVKRMALAAELLRDHGVPTETLLTHPSDTVRGWAAFAVALESGLSLADRLAAIRPLAADSHFGVREWAWLAIRPWIAAELETAIRLLIPWTAEGAESLRRFASESTRPRGVWCAHIAALRQRPADALPLLEPLKADPSRYVQDSVGNWLNDAAKDHPDWVRNLCRRWSKDSRSESTERICRRAMRSLRAASPRLRPATHSDTHPA